MSLGQTGRQLTSYGSNTYTYNEDGIRTSKTSNGVTTKFYLDGTNIIEQRTGDTVLHFYYDGSDEIIGFTYGENDYFYVKNAMGDITGITDINGNLVASYTYDAWGKVLSVTGSNAELGNLNPFRYRSYYYDVETELYYLQSRYYDPEVGRFINSDDVSFIGATGSEMSYNAFAYCENNSINFVDPWGYIKVNVNVTTTNWYYNYRYLPKSTRTYYFEYYNSQAITYKQYGVNYYCAYFFFSKKNVQIIANLFDSINKTVIECNKNNILG